MIVPVLTITGQEGIQSCTDIVCQEHKSVPSRRYIVGHKFSLCLSWRGRKEGRDFITLLLLLFLFAKDSTDKNYSRR